MVPFNIELDGERVGITFESLVWFFIVTALATLAGTIAYYYIQPYLPTAVTQLESSARTESKKLATTSTT